MKDFVKYEQALELKELGFDEPCFKVYDTMGYVQDEQTMLNMRLDYCSAPTFSQAFRFFREKYQTVFCYEPCLKKDLTYIFFIYVEVTGEKVFVVESKYNEEAELDCLIKLIETVKTKQP
jgi:hypothetical protein